MKSKLRSALSFARTSGRPFSRGVVQYVGPVDHEGVVSKLVGMELLRGRRLFSSFVLDFVLSRGATGRLAIVDTSIAQVETAGFRKLSMLCTLQKRKKLVHDAHLCSLLILLSQEPPVAVANAQSTMFRSRASPPTASNAAITNQCTLSRLCQQSGWSKWYLFVSRCDCSTLCCAESGVSCVGQRPSTFSTDNCAMERCGMD